LEQARKKVGEMLRENPSSLQALTYSALIENRQGENSKALELVSRALVLDPRNEFALEIQFDVFRELKRFSEAENTILSLLRMAPEKGNCYAKYALLMLVTLNLDKAQKLIAEARHLSPNELTVKVVSLLIDFAVGADTDRDYRLSDLIRNYPDQVQTTVAIILILGENGRHKEALKISQELLRTNPSDPDFLDIVINLKILAHPLMIPLYPVKRWEIGGALVYILWAVVLIAAFRFLGEWSLPLFLCFIAYMAYSWIVPFYLKKIIRKNL
jgi:tetratricopeptide (TPR) repeat protein